VEPEWVVAADVAHLRREAKGAGATVGLCRDCGSLMLREADGRCARELLKVSWIV
jgi:hypothetical protein